MAHNLTQVLPSVQTFIERIHGFFIDGRSTAASTGACFDVFNPATGTVLARVADCGSQDVEDAVDCARRTFQSRTWSGLRPADRERILLRLADLLETHAEELAQIETLNQGKSIRLARGIEVAGSVEYTRYMAGWSTKLAGETLDVSIAAQPGARYTAFTRREPVGVVAAIVPWNFPLMIAVWKLIPALAAGCTVVLKPAAETPLTALRLAELAIEAGVPPGVFNVVTGKDALVGQLLSGSTKINKITFTGSTAVGKKVGQAAVESMARFALELGGKNPMIVLDDVNVDKAVQGAIAGAFFNQGQVCAAVSRLYVHRKQLESVVDGIASVIHSMSFGSGMDADADINPLVSERHQHSVFNRVDMARDEGAQLIVGGQIPDLPGYFMEPTLFVAEPSMDSRVVKEEIFGPVLTVVPYDNIDQAVQMANDSVYGLAASLWTENLASVMNLIPQIQAGTVWVNTHLPLDPSLPFGGMKQSGMGREFGAHAVESFTELKSICISH
ncbi:aldehyde dehydrogenase [Paraburkholderia sp. B3]